MINRAIYALYKNNSVMHVKVLQSTKMNLQTFRNVSDSPKRDSKNEDKIKGKVLSSYVKFVSNYETKLEKKFPSAMHIYRLFTYGVKSFFQDLKLFVKVRFLVLSLSKREGFKSLTRSEIELYDQMPRDIYKISPVLLISALPFANYVIFPLAFMYPQKLLTSHFWTTEQKEKFEGMNLKSRLQAHSQLIKSLHYRLHMIENKAMQCQWEEVLLNLANKTQPSIEQILHCHMLFSQGPYALKHLHFTHTVSLLKMHNLPWLLSQKSKLFNKATILKEMDLAIVREGRFSVMTEKDLKVACFIRGLCTTDLSAEQMRNWLQKWLTISSTVEEESFSLLLHSPLLLGHCHPNNKLLLTKNFTQKK